jgi:signal transduction histidine kinase
MIMVDPSNFDTILSNLVENAIKYSTEKKYLGLKLTTTSKKVLLKVKDKGVGISKKDQAYIFDKFYRVEDTMTAETKGHGLGLSIVKNLVELNGGTIKVDSKPTKGSVFTVSFPIFIDAADDPGFTTNFNEHQKEQATSDKINKTNYVS